MTQTPHSEFILTDVRDDWWNSDFIELMASRLSLSAIHRVLDVGSGHGHWGHLWARHFSPDAVVLGIDREPLWVREAQLRSDRLGLGERFSYRCGSTDALPVEDASFDMVTCQTVLMHVGDPLHAVAEMKRALVPGGLLLLAEPNNLASLLMLDSNQREQSIDELMQRLHFHLLCSRGRIVLGEGDHSIGNRLPQILADQGFIDIQVHINDHASPVFSDDTNEAHRIQALEQKVENIHASAWLWDIDEARRLYRAGGGQVSDFARDYGAFMSDADRFVNSVRTGTYSETGGGQHYLISARSRST